MLNRSIRALAALACSALLSPAFAADVTVSLADTSLRLNSTFTASRNLAAWLSLHQNVPAPVGLGVVSSTMVEYPNGNGDPVAYVVPTLTTPVTTVTYDNTTGDIRYVSTSGGMRISSQAVASLLDIPGGQVQIEDLAIAFAPDHSASVYGHLRGLSATGASVDSQRLLFTAASGNVSGSTIVSASPDFQFTLSHLFLTQDGFDDMVTALGISHVDISYSALQYTGDDFGSLTIGAPSSVPEPGSMGLMGLGLMGLTSLVGAARRQQARAASRTSATA